MQTEECLQYIEHARHLREDERTVRAALQLAQENVELLQFTAVILHEALVWEVDLGTYKRRA